MKNIFVVAVVICALAIAGVGGTLAGWSDTEESTGNYIITGGLDLKVNGADDLPYGTGVGAVVDIADMQPCDWWEVSIQVRNDGQSVYPNGEVDPDYLYIMFKNFVMDNVDPIHGGIESGGLDWYYITQFEKPEPELVAEYGGVLGQVDIWSIWGDAWLPGVNGPSNPDDAYTWSLDQSGDAPMDYIWGIGPLAKFIEVMMFYDGQQVFFGTMDELLNYQFYLGECNPCGADHNILLKFHLIQLYDENWPADYWPEKFAGWQTNALMLDKVNFDIMFELLDHRPVT